MVAARIGLGVLVAVLVLAISVPIGVAIYVGSIRAAMTDNPFEGRTLYVDPDSSAAVAAAADPDAGFEAISETAVAIWLLPESHPAGEIGDYLTRVTTAADLTGSLPVFVVYGIPNRDCGSHSAGGTTLAGYRSWIAEIADALTGHESVVILEPDSLASASECGNIDERIGEIHDAVTVLVPSGATVYLDAGHSSWVDADTMANLLRAAGVSQVRGFATNVSNYNATVDERVFGERLSGLLDGAHFVIDVSRNGNGSNGEWCNPSGRALGEQPHPVEGGNSLDAVLWIKSPGESDGPCNGGPRAGEWWPQRALELIAAR